NKISVQIIIEKKISKVVSDINISIKDINENFNYKITPETLEVEIYGFVSIVNEVKPSDFEAYISVLDLTPGEHNLKINITSLKEEIKIVRIIPSEIKVIVTKKEE
ncbi:MAG TPA: CdaR family protein, partial [Caldisericia bacterium]|nr:CdaR family protein [Caldisericia bacterium]